MASATENFGSNPNMSIVMSENLKSVLCATCLSINRVLHPLKAYRDLSPLLNDVGLDINDSICWECRALVDKFDKFKNQARRSISTLNFLLGKNINATANIHNQLCLSTLKQCTKNNFDAQFSFHIKEEKIEFDDPSHMISLPINTCVDSDTEPCQVKEEVFLLSSPEDEMLQCREMEREQTWFKVQQETLPFEYLKKLEPLQVTLAESKQTLPSTPLEKTLQIPSISIEASLSETDSVSSDEELNEFDDEHAKITNNSDKCKEQSGDFCDTDLFTKVLAEGEIVKCREKEWERTWFKDKQDTLFVEYSKKKLITLEPLQVKSAGLKQTLRSIPLKKTSQIPSTSIKASLSETNSVSNDDDLNEFDDEEANITNNSDTGKEQSGDFCDTDLFTKVLAEGEIVKCREKEWERTWFKDKQDTLFVEYSKKKLITLEPLQVKSAGLKQTLRSIPLKKTSQITCRSIKASLSETNSVSNNDELNEFDHEEAKITNISDMDKEQARDFRNTDMFIKILKEDEMLKCREKERQRTWFKNAKFRCISCIRYFTSLQAMNQHNLLHCPIQQGQFACAICEMRFRSQGTLMIHQKSHYLGYICRYCSYTSSSTQRMMAHWQGRHDASVKKVCKDCRLEFLTHQDLHYHWNTVHRAKPLMCRKSLNSSSLSTHLRLHRCNTESGV